MGSALKDLMLRKASGTTATPLALTGVQEPRLVSIPLGLLDPDPNQPRKELGDLQELESSIGTHGLLQPIIVEPVEDGRYRILAGERRFTACRNLQWKTVSCIVRTVAQQSRLALQLIENLQRKDLHPIEEAQAYQRLMTECKLTQRDLAQRVGKSLTTVNESLRILDVTPEVLADVRTSEHGSKALLLELAKVPEPEAQRDLWEQIKAGKMTARRARFTKRQAKGKPPRKPAITISLPDATVTVRFKQGEANEDRVKAVLDQALAGRR
jgi:ParB family chromosome partitioning protein